jgi:hypothetical protein
LEFAAHEFAAGIFGRLYERALFGFDGEEVAGQLVTTGRTASGCGRCTGLPTDRTGTGGFGWPFTRDGGAFLIDSLTRNISFKSLSFF